MTVFNRDTKPFAVTSLMAFVLTLLAMTFAHAAQTGPPVAIRGGTVLTMEGDRLESGTVVFADGKITAVGRNVRIPAGAVIVEASGKTVMPGLINAMTSVGLETSLLDLPPNEVTDTLTPQLHAIDGFNPYGRWGFGEIGPIRLTGALSGGVTTQYVGPGDATLIGGMGVILKTAGDGWNDIQLVEPAAMDMTLGEPPKKNAGARKVDPATRMAELAMIRQILIQAQEYQRTKADNPDHPHDMKMEALGLLLSGEIPARIQANADIDIRSALELSDEFGFRLIIDGGTSAYQNREALKARGVPVVMGPVANPYLGLMNVLPDPVEYEHADEGNAARFTEAGLTIAFASFSIGNNLLGLGDTSKWILPDAAIAGGYGMADEDILKALTINPARILGIDERVGSLRKGKDADVIVLGGDPLSIRTWVETVYVNGELVYSRKD